MWYLGPNKGLITCVVKSCALPLPARNVSTDMIITLQTYPAYYHRRAFTGGSSANSLVSTSLSSHCTKNHPLRALSSFLHPLTVFSTLLLGGAIVMFGFIISIVLLTSVWVICSYYISLIQPYPQPCHPDCPIPANAGIQNYWYRAQYPLFTCDIILCYRIIFMREGGGGFCLQGFVVG